MKAGGLAEPFGRNQHATQAGRAQPTMTDQPELLQASTSSYVRTHCVICKAGWVRKSAEGGMVVICLLDREPVWPQMVNCDRYEARE